MNSDAHSSLPRSGPDTRVKHAGARKESAQPPNVLIIHADQHRWDCIGAAGNPDVETPNIDALARAGVRYCNSFCCYPVCTPSRYSLLSGLHVHQHLGWTNHSTLSPALPTFPRILRDAGYATKAVGKMHFTPTYLDVGFDDMVLAEQDGPGRWDDDYHRDLKRLNLVDAVDIIDQRSEYRQHAADEYWRTFGAVASDLPAEHHSTSWIGSHALAAVDDWNRGTPNLLMVGFIKPHHPHDPPAPWSEMYDPETLTLLPGWTEEVPPLDRGGGYFPNETLTAADLRRMMAMYYGNVSHIDDYVGRLVERLKERGLYENTMIIYTSDHGDHLGYHHLGLKGGYLYDSIMRVPLIVKYPGGKDEGTVSRAMVNNIDVAPTILGQAGREIPHSMPGSDLLNAEVDADTVFAENAGGREYAVRTGTRKLLYRGPDGTSQFFDLENDPEERVNLFDDPAHREEIDELLRKLMHWQIFGSRTPNVVDEEAPVIRQPNAQSPHDGHREETAAYYRQAIRRSHLFSP